MAIISAGALAQAVVRSGSAAWVLMPGIALVGAGAGLVMAPLTSAALALVPHQKAALAAGTLTTFRQLGYALGIAVPGEVFSGGLSRSAGSLLASSLSGGLANAVLANRPGLSHLVHEAFASALDQILMTAAALGLAGAVTAFAFVRIPRQDATPATARTFPASPTAEGVGDSARR